MMEITINKAGPFLRKGRRYTIIPYPGWNASKVEAVYVGTRKDVTDGEYMPSMWNHIFDFSQEKNSTFKRLLDEFYEQVPQWKKTHAKNRFMGVDNNAVITLQKADVCY